MAMSKLAKDQLKFVDPPADEFNCPICLGILQEPYLTACCGNHFCEACINKVKEGANKCPLCQETPLNGIINKSLRRKLNALKVYCMQKETGCRWIGDLGKLEQHLATGNSDGECQFVLVKCTASDLCKVEIPRKSLKHHTTNDCHYRQFKCKYCGYQSTFIIITTEHCDQCLNYPITCPNRCSKDIYRRAQLDTHLDSCPEQEVDCTFSEIGCKDKVKCQQLRQHLETNLVQHQLIMLTTIKLLQNDKEELQKQISAMALKDTNWPLYLQKISQIMNPSKIPVIFEIPFIITALSRCESEYGHYGNYYSAPPYHSPVFYSHPNGYKLQLEAKFISHCYWCSAQLFTVFPPVLTLDKPSADLKEDCKFFSVSIDLCIIKGEYDTNLKWPFEGKIAVTMLNKQVNNHHLKKVKHYKGECAKNNETSRLIVKQDTDLKQFDELKAEFELHILDQKTTVEIEKIQSLYDNIHTFNNPSTLAFPLYDLNDSTLYFEVTFEH